MNLAMFNIVVHTAFMPMCIIVQYFHTYGKNRSVHEPMDHSCSELMSYKHVFGTTLIVRVTITLYIVLYIIVDVVVLQMTYFVNASTCYVI
jgi:hypothetical protein